MGQRDSKLTGSEGPLLFIFAVLTFLANVTCALQ